LNWIKLAWPSSRTKFVEVGFSRSMTSILEERCCQWAILIYHLYRTVAQDETYKWIIQVCADSASPGRSSFSDSISAVQTGKEAIGIHWNTWIRTKSQFRKHMWHTPWYTKVECNVEERFAGDNHLNSQVSIGSSKPFKSRTEIIDAMAQRQVSIPVLMKNIICETSVSTTKRYSVNNNTDQQIQHTICPCQVPTLALTGTSQSVTLT
jgi:hypothetical protein